MFRSGSANGIPPAVTEQTGRRARNVIGREGRQVRLLVFRFVASKDDFEK